jgi:hypothetical protein
MATKKRKNTTKSERIKRAAGFLIGVAEKTLALGVLAPVYTIPEVAAKAMLNEDARLRLMLKAIVKRGLILEGNGLSATTFPSRWKLYYSMNKTKKSLESLEFVIEDR